MVTLTHMTPQKMDYMVFNSNQSNILYKIIQQLMDKLFFAGELVVKAQYFFSNQENTNCHQKQQPLQQTIIVPTRKIIHPRLDVIIIR